MLLCTCCALQAALAVQNGDAVITSDGPGITIVAVDGHTLKSPQGEIAVSPGRHHLVLRVNLPALGYEFPSVTSNVADAPLDKSFQANHRYSLKGKLTSTGGFTLVVADLTQIANCQSDPSRLTGHCSGRP